MRRTISPADVGHIFDTSIAKFIARYVRAVQKTSTNHCTPNMGRHSKERRTWPHEKLTKGNVCHSREGAAPTSWSDYGFGHRPLSPGFTKYSRSAAPATLEKGRGAAPVRVVADSATVRPPLASRNAHEEPRLPLQRRGGPVYLFEPLRIRPPSVLPWPHDVLTKGHACHSREAAAPRRAVADSATVRPPLASRSAHEGPRLPLQRGGGPP